MKRFVDILFVIVALLAICEFLFVRGLFTWLIALISIILVGIIKVINNLIHKNYYEAILSMIVVISICSGYFVIA